jgi:hypothetical protein
VNKSFELQDRPETIRNVEEAEMVTPLRWLQRKQLPAEIEMIGDDGV